MPQTNACVANGTLPPDIYTENLATTLTYAINFEYVAEADVVVYREQPAGTYTLLTNSATAGANNYTINEGVDPSVVTFTTAPGGTRLIIGRRTNICDPLVEYQVGASIRAQDMNLSNEQLLFLIQETRSILGFMVNGNDTDPIIPGTGISLNDLDDVDVEGSTNRSWFYYNGTEWVDGRAVMSGEDWISNNQTTATTAAMDARFTDATADVVGLIWTQDEDDATVWRATQFRTAPGAEPVPIADTDILPQGIGNADVLVIEIGGGNFAVVATSGPWNWDTVAGNFVVTVTNPVTENFINEVTDLTGATGITTAIANYVAGDPDPAYASDTRTTQTFGTDADATIRSDSDDATGGEATATVNFQLVDDTAAPVTAALTATWRNATTALGAINLPEQLFLTAYDNTNLTVTIGGITTATNSETELTSTTGDPAVATDDTFSVNDQNGSFNSVVTFDPPISNGSNDRTITATTTFSRPAGVTGTAYTVDVEAERPVTTNFTTPNIWRQDNAAPTNANVVNGTAFAGGWTEFTGDEITVPGVTTPTVLWAGFNEDGAPTTAQMFIAGDWRDVIGVGTTDVELSPTGEGQPPDDYDPVTYTFLSFNFNQTAETRVRYV